MSAEDDCEKSREGSLEWHPASEQKKPSDVSWLSRSPEGSRGSVESLVNGSETRSDADCLVEDALDCIRTLLSSGHVFEYQRQLG
jgi:hypothetical protein